MTSLTALREAKDTAYFKDGDKLWVKLVVQAADYQGPLFAEVGKVAAQPLPAQAGQAPAHADSTRLARLASSEIIPMQATIDVLR